MNESQVINLIHRGRSLKEIFESVKYNINLACGESFGFYDYKVVSQTDNHIDLKINFKHGGRYVPYDRIRKRAGHVVSRYIHLTSEMVVSSNLPELNGQVKIKQPRKSKEYSRMEIIGALAQELGRMPSESEIINYKK